MNDISQDMFFIWIVIRKVSHKVTISVLMMTSSNENISTLLALCAGNSPVTGEPASQKASDAELWCFNDLRLNKRLSKQSRHRWFETSSLSLWRHGENYSVTVTLPEHLKSPTIHMFFQRFILTNNTKKVPPLRITGFLWKKKPNHNGLPLQKTSDAACIFHVLVPSWKWPRHDDVIKLKHFPRYWPYVLGIHRSPVNSPHKGQWRGALMFSLIYTRINGWVNDGEAGDLRRHRAHYGVTVLSYR